MRLSAMGLPMMPRPTNPTLLIAILLRVNRRFCHNARPVLRGVRSTLLPLQSGGRLGWGPTQTLLRHRALDTFVHERRVQALVRHKVIAYSMSSDARSA